MKQAIIYFLLCLFVTVPLLANAGIPNAHQKLLEKEGIALKKRHITPKNALVTLSAFATMVMTLLYLGEKAETMSIKDQEIKARTDLYKSLAGVCDSLHKCR